MTTYQSTHGSLSVDRNRQRRRLAGAGLLAVALIAQLGASTVTAAPASATSRLTVTWVATTLDDYDDRHNSSPFQQRSADCPTGTHVIGGGARVENGKDQVRLTQLIPVVGAGGHSDYFSARAEEPDTGYSSEWEFIVYALCAEASQLHSYKIVSHSTTAGSSRFQQAIATCPSGTLALGGGGAIYDGDNQVGLQLVRPSGPQDIFRATGREDADGFGLDWHATSYAVCADRISDAAVYDTITDTGGNEACPPDKQVYSVGGGGGTADSGAYFLQSSYPASSAQRSYTVQMTGRPTVGTVVTAVCGP
jgi:hypothetical protein